MNLENRRSWWRRYLDPKGTQRRGGLDARMTNRRQIINLSIHGWFLLPFPPLWRTIAAVGVVFCAKYAEYWILPSLLESRGISCLPLAIYFRLPLSSPFIVFFSLPFREKAWYCIYIYMVNREFVHWQKHISDRDQREVVEEKLRDIK